jgi:hypothetical protein
MLACSIRPGSRNAWDLVLPAYGKHPMMLICGADCAATQPGARGSHAAAICSSC